jgi:hypothetical protein
MCELVLTLNAKGAQNCTGSQWGTELHRKPMGHRTAQETNGAQNCTGSQLGTELHRKPMGNKTAQEANGAQNYIGSRGHRTAQEANGAQNYTGSQWGTELAKETPISVSRPAHSDCSILYRMFQVNILRGQSIGQSNQKCLYKHVSYSERIPRYSHLTV